MEKKTKDHIYRILSLLSDIGRVLLLLVIFFLQSFLVAAEQKKITVGVTLHPCYSWPTSTPSSAP